MLVSSTRSPLRTALVAMTLAVGVLLTACTGSPEEPPPPPSVPPTSEPSDVESPPPIDPAERTPLGAKWDWSRFEQFEPFLEDLAGSSTFYEAVWCDIEKEQGEVDWSTLDSVVARSQQVGVEMQLKIRVGRCWATVGTAEYERGAKNKTESAMPRDMGDYREFVTAMVSRYASRGVHTYAIENEINSRSFWAGTPAEYRELAETAAELVRAADDQAEIVDAGLSSTTYGYGIADRLLRANQEEEAIAAWNAYYERRIGTRGDKIPEVTDRAGLQEVLDSEQGRRNLEYLSLMSELAEEGVVDVRQIHYYEKWSAVADLFTYLRATTPESTPIEAWEVGSFLREAGADVDRDQEVLKTASLILAEGAREVIWLPLAVDPKGRNSDEPRFGLLDPDGTPRPAGDIYHSLADAARGSEPVPVDTGELVGVGFDHGAGATAFVWSPTGTTVALSADEKGQVVVGGDDKGPEVTGKLALDEHPHQLTLSSTVDAFVEAQP